MVKKMFESLREEAASKVLFVLSSCKVMTSFGATTGYCLGAAATLFGDPCLADLSLLCCF